MLSFTLIVVCAGVFASAAQLRNGKPRYELEDAEQHFTEFVSTHNKQYASEQERQMRFEIFKNNLLRINKKNEEEEHAEYGITSFTDLTKEEFLNLHTGYKIGTSGPEHTCVKKHGKDITWRNATDAFDWRDHGAVTEVKNQGGCGSCWAFSVIANLEGQYGIKYKKLIDFSQQQLLDCDERDDGCFGGYPEYAAMSLIETGGVMTDEDYPYVSTENYQCLFDIKKSKAKVADCYQYHLDKDEELLKNVLHSQGPLSIAIDANSLMDYVKGIIVNCPVYGINHAVLLVGYGEENGVPYWIVKNSWSLKFGEEGYFRMKRGINACGMLNDTPVTVVL